MSAKSDIQWTDATFNPTLGCDYESPGCANCYAVNSVHRMAGNPNVKISNANKGLTRLPMEGKGGGPRWVGDGRFLAERLAVPVRWREGRRIFVNSLSDLFLDDFSNEEIAAVFGVMAAAPQHTFQVLTKRAGRLVAWFNWFNEWRHPKRHIRPALAEHAAVLAEERGHRDVADVLYKAANKVAGLGDWPLRNVWMGVSVESQPYAESRIPMLLRIPAAVHFISAEPLLGPLDLERWMPGGWATGNGCRLCGFMTSQSNHQEHCQVPHLQWIIAGGESGNKARPCHLDWLRGIVRQAKAGGVPLFMKQLGDWPMGFSGLPASFGPKGENFEQWPEELRVREFPKSNHQAGIFA